jgi:uncharacterized protein (TIGR03118 family)
MNTRSFLLEVRNVAAVLAMLPAFNATAQTTANAYIQHNLVSDVAGQADVTDPNLVNPWGIAETATSPFWVSDNSTGLATLYNGSGAITALVVKIPAGAATQGIGSPTGQVPGNGTSWILPAPNGKVASFIFATYDGTIAAWNSSVANSTAVTVVDNSAAGGVYTGLASSPTGTPLLFAANLHTGNIDVFDANFKPTTVGGGFADPNLPAGYAPFNITNLGGKLYVTYALQNAAKTAEMVGAGTGVVDIFDLNGNLLQRLVSNGVLNAPWGVALAPNGWGIFGGDVLVGNFGDGTISGFNPTTGAFVATMMNGTTFLGGGAPGTTVVNPGLWTLQFGNGKSGGDPQTLYITSSVNIGDNKIHGLLAALTPPTQVTGIVNAAGYTGGSIAPGEIVLINGFNIGPSPLATDTIPATGSVGTTAGSTTVTFNGTPAPVLYASASAVGVIVPYEVFGSPSATVQVTYKTGFMSPAVSVPVALTAPGLFTVSETGTGEVVAYNFDGTLNTAANPVERGFPVLIYETGEGQTDPTGADGLIANGLFVRTPFATVTATVAGLPANVVYAGSAAGNVAGIMEVEVIVPALPASTAGGALPIMLTVGGVNSQPGTTIFVK